MSDEQIPEPTDEELLAILNDAELLKAEGVRITPKGHMGMILMEHGFSMIVAEAISQVMEDRIFKDGWIYVRADEIELVDPSE